MDKAGIYISIPFCRQKCTYCNFASDVHPSSLVPRYLSALQKEITASAGGRRMSIPQRQRELVDTIYIGGGTPGMLDAGQLSNILGAIQQSYSLADGAEITIEASPENVTPANALAWAATGINRVSLGVQSMVQTELRAVGRLHDAQTVAQALDHLRAAGIDNVSVDLIAGLPNQAAASWETSLRALVAIDPAHLSIYMLEVDEDSRLGHEILAHGSKYQAGAMPTEEAIAGFYRTAMELLRGAGFDHYEISNFSRPGYASRHNMKYWTNVPYYGFGADAHSYDGERRWSNAELLSTYLDKMENGGNAVIEEKPLSRREKLEERFFLGLRRRKGISLSRLNAEFGDADPVQMRYAGPIREFGEAGWLQKDGDHLRLTDSGVLFSNEVFAGFIGEEPDESHKRAS